MKFLTAALALSLSLATAPARAETNPHARAVGLQRLELARVLMAAYDAGATCETEAYPSTIVDQVQAARGLLEEADLASFRENLNPQSTLQQNLAFRQALGQVDLTGSDLTEASLTKALTGTIFYHFGQGAYGSGYNVTLREAGAATEEILEVLNDEPWTRWRKEETSWRVTSKPAKYGHDFHLVVGAIEFRMERQSEGEIWWVPVDVKEGDTDYLRTLSSSDSLCDA